jgi:hypothetical protein
MKNACDSQGVCRQHTIPLIITVVMMVTYFLTGCVPVDEQRDAISLKEAQKLAPFPICLPTYLSENTTQSPEVSYHADFGDPMESDIKLRYFDTENGQLVIEIYQRHRPGAGTSELVMDQNNQHKYYERELMIWLGFLKWSHGEERYTIPEEDITITRQHYDDGIGRWLFQLEEPADVQANMIIWGDDPVWYQLYTRFGTDQAKEIARSISKPDPCVLP